MCVCVCVCVCKEACLSSEKLNKRVTVCDCTHFKWHPKSLPGPCHGTVGVMDYTIITLQP